MHSSLWKFFNSSSAYVCFFVFQIDKTIFFSYSNTRHASIESFILSYYSVFYTLIKHWNARMSVHFFVVVRTVGSLVIMRDYSFTRVNARRTHRNWPSTVFWCSFFFPACTSCPHTSEAISLSDRNYGAYVSSFPNYYREIVLCVVTCCVYNYLFSHERRKKNNESIWSWYVAQIPSHGYLSSQWPEQTR